MQCKKCGGESFEVSLSVEDIRLGCKVSVYNNIVFLDASIPINKDTINNIRCSFCGQDVDIDDYDKIINGKYGLYNTFERKIGG